MPKQLRLLATIIFFTKCFMCEAQIVKASSHDELAATKKRPLSTSTSSGGGASGECWAEIHTSELNLLDETTALLCLNDSITLNASGYVQWYYNDLNHLVDSYIEPWSGDARIVVKKPGVYYAKSDACLAGILVTSTLPVTIQDSTMFCPGGSVTLKAPNRELSSYQWYNGTSLLKGKKQKRLIATEAGYYYAKITDIDNCVLNSDKINVSVYYPPGKITITGDSCIKTGLNLDASSSKLYPQSISWYKGSKLIKTFNNKGIVVAGGNGAGSSLNQLDQPHGIFLDAAKNLFVADHNNERIVKWALGASAGEVIAEDLDLYTGFPTDVLLDNGNLYVSTTDGVYELDTPFNINYNKISYQGAWGLGIDSDRSIYSAQGGNPELPAFNGSGGNITKTDIWGNTSWVAGFWGSPEEDLASINYPNGVYVDASKNVYVADNLTDSFNNYYGRIVKWAPGAVTGELVRGAVGTNNAPNHIGFAAGIAFDKKGNMYVADAVNNRVQLWMPGAPHGITIISGFRPWGIKVDDDMNVYVTDQIHNRVLKFPSLLYNKITANSAGTYKAVITYPGGCTVTSNSIRVKNCNGFANDILNAAENNLQWSFTLDPNPVQTILRVRLTKAYGNTTVNIIDAAGRKLYTQHINASGNDEFKFNTNTLHAGLYFMQVINSNQSRYSRFVKE